MKKNKSQKKALTTQVLFFILMSFIFVWIIFFGFGRISDVQDTLSKQQEIEIKSELEAAFSFCSDPINSGSLKIIDLKNRPYNSICFNCQKLDDTIIPQNLIEDAQALSESGSNFLLLDTNYPASGTFEYNILGELSIEELGYDDAVIWIDTKNTREQKIEIKCE